MSDGSASGMSFPQKVHTEDEDFVIELDDSHLQGQQDGYGIDDRSRCKRRKRCGQCGPCQVKENCMKCHFCIRKDVLKQTCIYRKCIYLRSKPKPYSRPHQSPQGRMSPSKEMMQAAADVKSPPLTHTPHAGMPFPDAGIPMPEARPENHPFFPAQLPQQAPVPQQQNNGYVSPPNPVLDTRTPSLPNHTAGTNMNMQMSASPHVHSNATSPVQKIQEASSPPLGPHPINSPMGSAVPGITPPVSSCPSFTPHIPSMPAMGPSIPPVFSPISSSSFSSIPPSIPALPNMSGMNERTVNEFRPPDQFSLPPHHPHPHYPTVHPHPHMAHRDSGLFRDPTRMAPMNFNTSNHIDSFGRGPNDSSCMYHPGLPYSMPAPFQPSGPSFIPGAAEMNPFRSNFLNTFPPGYSYPPDRFREGFGSLPFSRLGMTTPPAFSQYPGQGHGYGLGNSFSQQYYNSQHGCPKNGSRPPVSPSTDDVKVIQEGYKNQENDVKSQLPVNLISRCSNVSETATPCSNLPNLCSSRSKEVNKTNKNHTAGAPFSSSVYSEMSGLELGEITPRMDHLKVWSDYYLQKTFGRNEFTIPPMGLTKSRLDANVMHNLRPPMWETWKMPPMYSPRRDDVHSRASTSTMSSDFECEVISIDDHQMNALIRSDGCNSIEIEFDNRSLSSNEDSSPRKLPSVASVNDPFSPFKNNCFQPIERLQISEPRSLFSPWEENVPKNHANNAGMGSRHSGLKIESGNKPETQKSVKAHFKGSVCIRQDLGEEGVMQLELPGRKVTIEDTILNEDLINQCSNISELKEFIRNGKCVGEGEKDRLQITV